MKKKLVLMATFAIIGGSGLIYALSNNSGKNNSCCEANDKSCCTEQLCSDDCTCGSECDGSGCECGCTCCE